MKFKFGIKEVVATGIGTALFVALTQVQIPMGFIPIPLYSQGQRCWHSLQLYLVL